MFGDRHYINIDGGYEGTLSSSGNRYDENANSEGYSYNGCNFEQDGTYSGYDNDGVCYGRSGDLIAIYDDEDVHSLKKFF